MRAVLCRGWGDQRGLEVGEAPSPVPGPGEVLVRICAAALNFADSLMIAGKYQVRPPLPFTPGLECAGEVLALGPGVETVAVGQRVMALLEWGAFAERAVAPAYRLCPVPDGMGFTTAAAFPVAYGTAHIALADRGGLAAGEALLVHGATSGVGLAAIEVGKCMGAEVIAVARGPAKGAVARAAGADHVLDATRDDIRTAVKDLTGGRGADVIYDPIGGEAFAVSLRCVNWGGRILVVGFAGGPVPQIPANILLVKSVAAIGVFWNSHFERDAPGLRRSFETLAGWHAAGRLRPLIRAELPLERAGAAFGMLLDRSEPGKLVLRTGD